MTISVQGIGWVTDTGYGCVRSGLRHDFESGEGTSSLVKKGVFSHPFKNFGRLDKISKSAAYAVALALQDAGIEYSPVRKQDIGILGTNAEGSLATDRQYFEDYIRSGRKLSRGNLFIYTLPSSPLGEAAIHFGLLGPLLYVAAGSDGLGKAMTMAGGMIEDGEASRMLAGKADENEAVFFVMSMGPGPADESLCALSEALPIVAARQDTGVMIGRFAALAGGRTARA